MAWIRRLEMEYPDRTLIGVRMSTKGDEIRITPMWEEE